MLNFSAPICKMKKTIYLALLIFFASCKENKNVFDSLSAFYKPVTEPVLSRDSTAVFLIP